MANRVTKPIAADVPSTSSRAANLAVPLPRVLATAGGDAAQENLRTPPLEEPC
jgi:hypothetical protein